MEEFPFTQEEWDAVSRAAACIVNATGAGDDVLHAACVRDLQQVLAELRRRYGDHPVLLETEADFLEDGPECIALYEQAVRIAVGHDLPTLSIRLALARTLLNLGRPLEAHAELLACEGEADDEGDDHEQDAWEELAERARRG